MTNDPEVLGVDLVVSRETSQQMLNNDNSTGCADILTEVMTSGERSIKRTRISTFRSLLVQSISIPGNYDGSQTIELNSCLNYIQISMNCTIKASKRCQIITVKNMNANNAYSVTIKRDNESDLVYSILPNDSVKVCFDSTNNFTDNKSIDCLYPIGTILYTNSNQNPGLKIGGVWEDLVSSGDGRFAYTSSGASLVKGGANSIALSWNQVPAHRHGLSNHGHNWNNFTDSAYPDGWDDRSEADNRRYMHRSNLNGTIHSSPFGYISTYSYSTSGGATTSGSAYAAGSAHNNMPQYCTSYCWKRIG